VDVDASGFPSYSTARTPDTSPPAEPSDVRLRQGDLSGSLVARYKPARAASMNEVQTCTGDPNAEANWHNAGLFSGGKATISGITPDGHLFMQVRPASFDTAAVVGFLRVLMRKIAGPIVVIWDGATIHRGHEIKDFLKRGATKRLHLEQLPGYAPDLNPDEGIWNYLKRVELGNVCCSDLDQLHRKLIQAKERLRHKKEIIKSCSRQCGYLL